MSNRRERVKWRVSALLMLPQGQSAQKIYMSSMYKKDKLPSSHKHSFSIIWRHGSSYDDLNFSPFNLKLTVVLLFYLNHSFFNSLTVSTRCFFNVYTVFFVHPSGPLALLMYVWVAFGFPFVLCVCVCVCVPGDR